MENQREIRKNEHVKLALAQNTAPMSDFDRIHFVHHAIPNINKDEVSLLSTFSDFKLTKALYINAMTGGSNWTLEINQKLARIAKEVGVPMAVGSMHAALNNKEVMPSYKVVRQENPDGVIWANVSADASLEEAKCAVDMIKANALQIHVNAPQELVMPEGSRKFKHWQQVISEIVQGIDVPVIVKEVGFGMSYETIVDLIHCGVAYVDVSGKGGTNFASIENERRQHKDMSYMQDWGQSTAVSLLEARNLNTRIHILASGGIRHPLDAIKALRLGAEGVGMSRNVLQVVQEDGVDAAIDYLNAFHEQMQKIMTLLSVKDITSLRQSPIVIDEYLKSWIQQRQLY
ncbi:type 2 isopentenyl-diphosphate Delta-isomerase [Staphylococcus ratti]|uniref:Isopentenyl-diphosphate delta-isomerase n=1 Tax=Staphylococcus ratti TaxID=2892440 RepID=A0ABY3PDT4_9STAP|nr:type 2 isopentenyl-diphosphate Delta-isomerase [Staphylococcus ratti]UEX90491.1 type 2 isopentenyl-diphosphate Delta-isomerase [Staphylococcus ratti]